MHQLLFTNKSCCAACQCAQLSLIAGAQLTFIQGIDTLERFHAQRYYGDGLTVAMHAVQPCNTFLLPMAMLQSSGCCICALHRDVVEPVSPHGGSAVFQATREWERAHRIRRGYCRHRRGTPKAQQGYANSCSHVYGHNVTYSDSPSASGLVRPGG